MCSVKETEKKTLHNLFLQQSPVSGCCVWHKVMEQQLNMNSSKVIKLCSWPPTELTHWQLIFHKPVKIISFIFFIISFAKPSDFWLQTFDATASLRGQLLVQGVVWIWIAFPTLVNEIKHFVFSGYGCLMLKILIILHLQTNNKKLRRGK